MLFPSQSTNRSSSSSGNLPIALLFGIAWVVLFVLYYPAAKAGFVTDFTGWLYEVRHSNFIHFVNRTHFGVKSMYQVTQATTWLLYQLLGTHAWLWHILFISLHALNSTLLVRLVTRLLVLTGFTSTRFVELTGLAFCCISPYFSEVIVWEPSFHYLTGLLMLLAILHFTFSYCQNNRTTYLFAIVAIYILSLGSLEVFYITPFLAAAVCLFFISTQPSSLPRRYSSLLLVISPIFLLLCVRIFMFRLLYGGWVSRIGNNGLAGLSADSFSKPLKYVFHLLLVGRYWPNLVRQDAYQWMSTTPVLTTFYLVAIGGLVLAVFRFSKLGSLSKVTVLLYLFMLTSLALVLPLWFGDLLLVSFDRYAYFAGAFFYLLVALFIARIPYLYVRLGLACLVLLPNLRFAVQASRYWGKSEKIISSLLQTLPPTGDKTVVLLNLPESMNGIPMFGAEVPSEYQLMRNLLLPNQSMNNKTYDVLAYNMLTPDDGATAEAVNDSTIKVTLNQWGTWWWYKGKGGYSYENDDYRLDLKDPGHYYELTLKKPSSCYILLYQTGKEWKEVQLPTAKTL